MVRGFGPLNPALKGDTPYVSVLVQGVRQNFVDFLNPKSVLHT